MLTHNGILRYKANRSGTATLTGGVGGETHCLLGALREKKLKFLLFSS